MINPMNRKEVNHMTPKELATELGVDPKRLRSFLRGAFPRPLEAKNTSWQISDEAIEAAKAKFVKEETPAEA
jgi:hypothetical protein